MLESEKPEEHNTSREAGGRRSEWVSRIIDAQASRVISQTEDVIELKPITIENRPPANIQRFLETATSGRKPGSIIDIYA